MTSVRVRGKRPWRRVAGVGALVLAGLAALVAVDLTGWTPPPPPLPVPNGYDTLVRAGTLVVGQPPEPAAADAATLRAFVTPNAEASALAAQGLEQFPRLPLGPSQASLRVSLENLGPIRRLGRLLIAKGMLAEREGRPGAAALAYLNAARLGPLSANGGFLVHEMTGLAVQAAALTELERLGDKLNAQESRNLAVNLDAIDGRMDSPASVIARERAWFRAMADWRMRIGTMVNPAVGRTLDALVKPQYQTYEAAGRRNLLRIRRLMALAAVRAYRLEVRADPPGLGALVPRYLAAVPLDPGDGRPLAYRNEPGDGLRLDEIPAEPADEAGRPGPDQDPAPG